MQCSVIIEKLTLDFYKVLI